MEQTRGLGRLFWHPIKLKPGAPRFSTSRTFSTDYPFHWSKSLVLRWGSKGVVIGWWRDNPHAEDEVTCLLQAISGRVQDTTMRNDTTMVDTFRKHQAQKALFPWTDDGPPNWHHTPAGQVKDTYYEKISHVEETDSLPESDTGD